MALFLVAPSPFGVLDNAGVFGAGAGLAPGVDVALYVAIFFEGTERGIAATTVPVDDLVGVTAPLVPVVTELGINTC